MPDNLSPTTRTLIRLALAEDLGERGDLTSAYFVDPDRVCEAWIEARQNAVVAGVEVAAEVFREVDPGLEIRILKGDGTAVSPDDKVIEIWGKARSILTAERTALNFLQQLSGVATATHAYVKAVEGAGARARILDTRKTIPGWRELQKAAVKAGGGVNHRMGLYDAVMVKDNHLLATGGKDGALEAGIRRLKADHPDVTVELEADRLEQVETFLGIEGVSFILLDNMSPAELAEAVRLRDTLESAVKLEASGGVTLETVAVIAKSGVDFISVGALTHSAPAADFALEFSSFANKP